MKEERKVETTAKGKVVVGFFNTRCVRPGCPEALHAVTECASDEQGRCRIIAQCTRCETEGLFVLNKKAMTCFDRAKGICPKWRPPKVEKDAEDTAPKKGEGRKIGWFARLFGR